LDASVTALFGGTFDPPHIGHLIIAEQVRDALGLEQVTFLPCGQPPHKAAGSITAARGRLRMLELAIGGQPGLGLSDLEIRRALRSQHPLSVMMLALDDYQDHVEKRGIDAGESLLRDVGALLLSSVRKGDIVCRYGGQAFILILPQGSVEVIRKRAEHLRERIYASEYNEADPQRRRATASVGLAVFPDHGQTVEALLRSAEAALNRARESGGNSVYVAS